MTLIHKININCLNIITHASTVIGDAVGPVEDHRAKCICICVFGVFVFLYLHTWCIYIFGVFVSLYLCICIFGDGRWTQSINLQPVARSSITGSRENDA